jgi:hypothetical protein
MSTYDQNTHLSDPHALMGLVAADGGPDTWLLLTSLPLAKEYLLTADRISARRAAEKGLMHHACTDDKVLAEAVAGAPSDSETAAPRRRGYKAHSQPPPRRGHRCHPGRRLGRGGSVFCLARTKGESRPDSVPAG